MAAGATPVNLSGNIHIDALLTGVRADTTTLTYGFPTAGSTWSGYASGSEPFNRFTTLSAEQQNTVASALNSWASVANLTFVPVAEPGDVADIRYAGTGQTGTAHTYYPHSSPMGGDVWLGARMTNAATWTPGNYEFETAVHETGHALGLKHPHDTSIGDATGGDDISVEMSVMSYRSYAGAALTETYSVRPGSYPAAPMIDDIAAVQYMYGANYASNAGDTVYRFAPDEGVILRTVWDGGGNDTYDLSAFGEGANVTLAPGQWSIFSRGQLAQLNIQDPAQVARGNVANAYLYNDDPRSLIENVIGGSGSDAITGNQADNALYGNQGTDSLAGAEGNDTLFGGQAGDLLNGNVGADVEFGNQGPDTLRGGQGSDALFGGQGGDELWGDLGNDTLFGDRGPDTLTGGGGGDLFVFGDGTGNDLIRDFNAAEGDRIQLGGASYTVGGGAAGAIVTFSGGALTLEGIDAGSVSRDWFVGAVV